MDTKGLYQRLYDEELSWRDQLSTAVGIPVGVAIVLGGVLALYARAFPGWDGGLGWWFGVTLVAGTLSLLGAVVQLIRARYGYTYERIPFPSEIREYEKSLLAFHQANGTESQFRDEFEEWLTDRMVSASDRNLQNDVQKSHHLHWSLTWLIAALVAIGLATPPYFFVEADRDQEVVQVEVIGANPLHGVDNDVR